MNTRKFNNWLKRSGYVIKKYDSKWIEEVLNGRSLSLVSAITWMEMPQDARHWARAYKGRKLSKRSRSFLSKLRDEAIRRGC